MKIAQLKSLIKHGESNLLEFKSSTGSLSNAMQTVCAFLNSDQGGTVVFGVKDDGTIIGQPVSDKTKKDIGVELSKIEPFAKIDIAYVPISTDRKVIVFIVEPGDKSPYSYDGRSYIRQQSTTTRMSKEEYTYLYNKHHPTTWESLPNTLCTLNDLDRKRIKQIIDLAISEKRLPSTAKNASIPDILKKLGLLINNKLTNAAVILFCKNEDVQFIQSVIQIARFKGTTKKEFLDSKILRANAFDLYDKALDFLAFYLPVAARIEEGKSQRVETPVIPYKVLREALANALVHRDYSHAGGSISIAIYDDRLNISNIGALPLGVQLSQLSKEHPSIQRNPLIANVFYLCGNIEKWGRGTLDMIEDCKRVGNPLPIFEEIGSSFSVTFPFKEPIRSVIYTQTSDSAKLTQRQKEIITILQQGALKSQEINEQLSKPLAERVMRLELAKLKKMAIIKSIGKTKSTLWSLIN